MSEGGAADLEYKVEGPEDAPVVVLVNSIGTTHRMWDKQMPALEGRFRILRYDQRGHGGSEVPDGPYNTIADLGGDLIALLDQLGLRKVYPCGLLLGGMFGMWFASEAPERVERLALCCTSALLGAKVARAEGVAALAGAVIERWYTPAMKEKDPQALEDTAAMLAIRDMDLRERLPTITATTLVIAGADDPATPPGMLQGIQAQVPGSTTTLIPEAARLANIEQPDVFNEALIGHLEPLPASSGDAL